MKLTSEKIQEFKVLYKKHFGENIDDKEALIQIQALLVITKLGLPP